VWERMDGRFVASSESHSLLFCSPSSVGENAIDYHPSKREDERDAQVQRGNEEEDGCNGLDLLALFVPVASAEKKDAFDCTYKGCANDDNSAEFLVLGSLQTWSLLSGNP